MPELPEVEAVCRRLRNELPGVRIMEARLLRKPNRRLERQVAGRKIEALRRRGKNILLELSGGGALRVHLRMTGDLYIIQNVKVLPVSVRFYLKLYDGRTLVLDDPRALGVVDLLTADQVRVLNEMTGPEPLEPGFTLDAARSSRQPAKLFLMDQRRVAGLGNIYAAEALRRARIHPAKPMNRLGPRRLDRLRRAIVEILTDAVQSACSAYAGPGQFEAGETFPLAVYGREGESCPDCGRRIRRIPQGGRSTYFCPGCQRQ
jgi:formamidopyrimidine-DNA glycosylase